MVDNNFFLSEISLMDWSQGGAYAHNLMAGKIISQSELTRNTPYHAAHSTTLGGLSNIKGGDNRFFNNIMAAKTEPPAGEKKENKNPNRAVGYGLWVYDAREFPLFTGGNAYFNNARPYAKEENFAKLGSDPKPTILEEGDQVYLQIKLESGWDQSATSLVATESLGKAIIPKLAYENSDGSPLVVDADYFGHKRNTQKPSAGPVENPGNGDLKIKVW
jgi:hypothetical protein